jgi:hypothetical protein
MSEEAMKNRSFFMPGIGAIIIHTEIEVQRG